MMCIHSYCLWATKGVIMFSASLYFALLSKFSKMKIPHFYNQERSSKHTHTPLNCFLYIRQKNGLLLQRLFNCYSSLSHCVYISTQHIVFFFFISLKYFSSLKSRQPCRHSHQLDLHFFPFFL